MNKEKLIKYIEGKLSNVERDEVIAWASENPDNKRYLIRLMNLWVSQNMPQNRADKSKYEEFKQYLAGCNSISSKHNAFKRVNIIAWSVAAAIILVLIGWNLSLKRELPENKFPLQAHLIVSEKTLYTDRGVKAKFVLPDSSIIWLNSESKITYSEQFGEKNRELYLSGEAYFDVVKDPSMPLIITTSKGFKVKVTGTTFNIKAYEDDDYAKTTLYTGSLSVIYRDKDNKEREEKIVPNQTIDITNDNLCSITMEHADEATVNSLWKIGKIHFDSTPVSEVIKILERWHGTKFMVQDLDILNYKISADFDGESIVQIMELIKLTAYIDYSLDDNKIILKKR